MIYRFGDTMIKTLFAKMAIVLAGAVVAAQALAFKTTAKQAFVYDLQSKQILFNKSGTDLMFPASMTKIMTAYVVFDAIKQGKISPDDKMYVSKKAWKMGGSRMFLRVDTSVTVDELIQGLIIQSGNDAAVVLAEGISGTEENFSVLMNQTARKLGMKNSNFTNSTGWPDKNHYTTAWDLVILSDAIRRHFPEYYPLWAVKNYTYNNIKQGNRNPLLYVDIGVDGLKTGRTEASGYGLTASAVKGDRRIIFVLNGMRSKTNRKEQGIALVREFLFNYRNTLVVNAGEVLDQAPISMNYGKKIPLLSIDDIYVSKKVTNTNTHKVLIEYKSPVLAPVKQGDEVGKIIIQEVDKNDRPVQNTYYPLYAGADVKKNSLFGRVISFVLMTVFGTP